MNCEISPKFSIASELRRRIRIRSKAFKSPALDPAYMEMALESLPAVKALYVNHKRLPEYLLPELEDRGFKYVVREIEEGDLKLIIYK